MVTCFFTINGVPARYLVIFSHQSTESDCSAPSVEHERPVCDSGLKDVGERLPDLPSLDREAQKPVRSGKDIVTLEGFSINGNAADWSAFNFATNTPIALHP